MYTCSLSHKTVNARENFWNVYCFATNQMRDETARDNRQTAAGISHDLDTKQRAGFFFNKKSSIPFGSLWKSFFFYHKPTPVTWQKPIYRIDLKVSANCENLQRYRSASWVKVLSYKKTRIENHQSQLTSMTFWTVRETNIGKHRLWLAHFFCSQTRCLALSDPVFLINFAFP